MRARARGADAHARTARSARTARLRAPRGRALARRAARPRRARATPLLGIARPADSLPPSPAAPAQTSHSYHYVVIFCICEVDSEPLNKEPDKIQHWQWAVWDSPEFDSMPLFAGLHNVRSAGTRAHPSARRAAAAAARGRPARSRWASARRCVAWRGAWRGARGARRVRGSHLRAAPSLRAPPGYHPFKGNGQMLPVLPPHGALSW